MKSLSIRTKLAGSFGIILVLSTIMCSFSIVSFSQIMDAANPQEYVKSAGTVVSVIGFIVIVFGMIVAALMVRTLRISLQSTTDAAKKIARGETDVKLEKLNDDEFGVLIDAMNEMVEGIREQAEVAEAVAKGNLTVSIKPRSEKDMLGKALNDLIVDTNNVIGNVIDSAVQVTTGAQQVAGASQGIAQGSTEQASALQQINASIDEIAETTRVNAAEANEANELVQEAKKSAVHGNTQMKDMLGAMNEINRASENISKIIKVIDDISFQTNILALNAAVEAARAGAHGKGFAVVAEEVRNLAAKSSSAASETAEMIEDSIRKVETGSKLAEETEKALDEIVDAVDRIVNLISHIARSSNEQALSVEQIDQAINQVSQVVQTNSATSEECAAASEELSNQVLRVKDLLGRYRLNHTSGMGYSSYSADENEKIISLGRKY